MFALGLHIVGGSDWTAKTTAIGTAITAAVLLVSAVVAYGELQEGQKTRYAELLTELSARWDNDVMRIARQAASSYTSDGLLELVEKIFSGTADIDQWNTYYRLQPLPNFLDSLGVIEYDADGINLDVANLLWGDIILAEWNRWQDAIDYMQNRPGGTRTYANFQLLKDRIEWAQKPEASRSELPPGRAD